MNFHTRLWFIKHKLKNNWFLCGLFICIVLAKIFPRVGCKGGFLKSEITVRYVAVCLIFFLSGFSLKTEEFTAALLETRVHCFIQGFTLIFIPLSVYLLTCFLSLFGVNEWILKGLITVSCMPPPVSSAVILTKSVGGNEAIAVFNSAFGSFLGIIVTPPLLLFFLGINTSIPLISTTFHLSVTVVLPLVVGQMTRLFANARTTSTNLNNLGSCLLLFIIYTTFCDTFIQSNTNVDVFTIVTVVFIVAFIQICFLLLAFVLSNYYSFSPRNTVAVTFCATHKSLTLGIPMLRILFSDFPNLSLISIPLLVYHPMQIMVGGIIQPYLRRWMLRKQTRHHPYFMASV